MAVSKAVRDAPDISAATKERVLLCDYRRSGALAVEHLAGLCHRDIALLTCGPEIRTITLKEEGLTQAMEGLGLRPRIIRVGHASDTMRAGIEAVEGLLAPGALPTPASAGSGRAARMSRADEGRRAPRVFLILPAMLLAASALTWLIPSGCYERVFDGAAGQTVVAPGSFAYTEPSPVAPWRLPLLIFEALSSGAVAALCAWVVRRARWGRIWIVPAVVGDLFRVRLYHGTDRFSVGAAGGGAGAAAGGAGAGGLGAGEIAAAFLVLGILSGLAAGFDGNRICASLVAGCRKMGPGALTIALAAALRLVPCL